MNHQSEFDFYMKLVKEQPVEFGKINGFEDLTDIHNEWIKSFLLSEDDTTLLAHRGSYKTTCLSVAIALIMILFPDLLIIFMRKTDDDVTEIVLEIQKLLLSDIYQSFSYALWGKDVVLKKATNNEIDTNLNGSIRGTSQLLAMGIGGSITGKHADIIITDDIVTVKDRVSQAERERTKLQYYELQNVKNRGGRFINSGTPWHNNDAISDMPNVKRFDCYQTGLIDKNQLKHLKRAMPASLFSANYELKHIADSEMMFNCPQFTTETREIYNGLSHIDAAYGGSDYTAYTIMREQADGSIVAFGKLFKKHIDDCLPEIILLHQKYQAGTIEIESNADKGYLAKALKQLHLPVNQYYEKMNKYIKISAYLKSNWSRITWLEATDSAYLNQILDYTEHSAHDDAPDSAASLLRKIKENRGWVF